MKRKLLYETIYNDLLDGIRNGTYPPGSRLPSEKELSEKYDVSRITSKKSLEMLADENLIPECRGGAPMYWGRTTRRRWYRKEEIQQPGSRNIWWAW